MTIFGADISHHQAGIDIQRMANEGLDFLLARVGQGAGNRLSGERYGTVRDREWERHRDAARRAGLLLIPYWYVGDLITPDDNARLCAEWMGDTTLPVALDHEDGSGSIAHFRATLDAFGRRGLRVVLSYIPRWYWSHPAIGSPSLAGLPPLWSSRYVSGPGTPAQLYPGDQSVHWAGYGGNTVAIAQFTNRATIAGRLVDADAFRGTRQQLAALLGGQQEEDDVSFSELISGFDRTYTAGQWLIWANHYAGQAAAAAQRNEKALAALAAAVADGDLDPDAVLARVDTAVRESTEKAIADTVLPALRAVVHEVLGEDNAEQADAIVDRIADRLRPAA